MVEKADNLNVAKLTVKVKLHPALPKELPALPTTAPLSKGKVTLALLLLAGVAGCVVYLYRQLAEPEATAQAMVSDQAAVAPAVIVPAVAPSNVPDDSAAAQSGASDLTASTSAATAPQTDPVITAPAQTTASTAMVTAKATPTASGTQLPAGFSRIVLAAQMERLEPGPAIAQLVPRQQIQRLYLFTELNGYAGQLLTHRWSFKGQVQTEAVLTIEDSPWRTYSEKWLLPDQLGSWRVEIIDQQQNVLYQHDFQYQ